MILAEEAPFDRDFYYYGNKLFQSDFIGIIQPGSTLIGQLQFNLLNSSVALVGYYAAAFTIDKPWMGRRRMQVFLPSNVCQSCNWPCDPTPTVLPRLKLMIAYDPSHLPPCGPSLDFLLPFMYTCNCRIAKEQLETFSIRWAGLGICGCALLQ